MSQQKTDVRDLLAGVLLALLSYFCLAATNVLVKLLNHRLDSAQILFCQSLFGLILIFCICFTTGKINIPFLKSKHYGLLFLRSISGLVAFLFIFISLKRVTVTDATLLVNTAPFFIPFLLLFFLKEPIKHLLWLGMIPGFVGIILILKPSSELFQPYALFPLISGFFSAMIFLSLKQLHHHKEPMLRILFYLFLFAALVILPFALLSWKQPTFQEWMLLFLSAIAAFGSQTAITVAVRFTSPKVLAPLCYASVVFALLFDWLIWHVLPSSLSILGIFFVIAGGIVAILIRDRPPQKDEKI